MTPLKKLTFFLMALVVLFGTLGSAAPVKAAPAAADCTAYHTIQRGETLYSIGLRYGVTWRYLADLNGITNPGRIFAGQRLCVSTTGTGGPTQPTTGRIPTFRIVSVTADTKVTIETANFPANDTFEVLMGQYGTRGVNGVRVDTLDTRQGGTLTATFDIPAALKGAYRIAIRLQSTTGSGYFSYNWFYNNTSGSGTGGGDTPTGGVYTGIPTFSIVSVIKDTSVTIRTNNFPANLTFDVLMGQMGTRGVGGVLVGTIESRSGGAFEVTIPIPAQLQGRGRIAIRTQNAATGYYSYNWFWNN